MKYLRFEPHVEHAICFIQNQVRHSSQIGCTSFKVINQTTRSSNHNLNTISVGFEVIEMFNIVILDQISLDQED